MANNDKKVAGGKIKKKSWSIHSLEGIKLDFFPVFEANKENGEIETRFLNLKFKNPETRKEQEINLNWLDIYMFVYFACNEEKRQNLALKYEREVKYIPYDVTIRISEQEREQGLVKRRVELPVDELQMAIARNEAFKILQKGQFKNDPSSFIYKGKK